MTPAARLQRMFVIFHVVLGLVLLYGGAMTALSRGHGDLHVRIMGGAEAVGAVLFLIPRTLRQGAWLLLLVIIVALAFHLSRSEWRPDLFVYAAGVAYIMMHGAAYRVPA